MLGLSRFTAAGRVAVCFAPSRIRVLGNRVHCLARLGSPVSNVQDLDSVHSYDRLILGVRMISHSAGVLFTPAPEQQVLVVDGLTSKKRGVMSFTEAEALAEDSDMLLHLVGRGKVPVYKMMSPHALEDLRMLQERLEKEAQRKQAEKVRSKRNQEDKMAKITKEVKMTAHAGAHDVETKLNQAKRFLAKGLRVKFVVTFRKRQARDKQQQADLLKALVEGVADHGQQVGDIEQQGMYVMCTIAPSPQQNTPADNDVS